MAALAVSSISQENTAPHWRTAAVVHANPAAKAKGPGASARAWVKSLDLPTDSLEIIALACAWFVGPDGLLYASRASIGAKAGRKGRTVRQVQRGLAPLIALGVLIELGWHTCGYRADGRPIRTRLYRMPVGTPAAKLVPAVPSTVRRAALRKASLAAKCHSLEAPECHSLENVESDSFGPPKGQKPPKMSHNPSKESKDAPAPVRGSPCERERTGATAAIPDPTSLTGAAREPLPYYGADRLNRLYARHGLAPTDPSRP